MRCGMPLRTCKMDSGGLCASHKKSLIYSNIYRYMANAHLTSISYLIYGNYMHSPCKADVKSPSLELPFARSDSLDHLQKTLETVVQRDLPKCEGQVEELKQDMAKAMAETAKRREALKELKGMVRQGLRL